jgi:hypothetical protein
MILELVTANSALLLKAQAYLDPGSGSFLIQLLLAGLVGAAFILRSSWGKIKRFFNRSKTEEVEEPKDGE